VISIITRANVPSDFPCKANKQHCRKISCCVGEGAHQRTHIAYAKKKIVERFGLAPFLPGKDKRFDSFGKKRPKPSRKRDYLVYTGTVTKQNKKEAASARISLKN